MRQYTFMFGIFTKGKLVFAFNKMTCTHSQAAVIVDILDMGKNVLMPGHYFACDYIKNIY